MSNNNGTGFWVTVALIAALSLVAVCEVAIATMRSLTGQLARALRRALAKRPANAGRGLTA